jgi:CMP-N,N'-diacetyllegionaminic acid synthase
MTHTPQDSDHLNKDFLALIPARGGSKRLPNKNVLPLSGKPLISWSIDVAKKLFPVENIVLSTDSHQIADIGIASGLSVPWLRPSNLSSDEASSVDVAIHALDWAETLYERSLSLVLFQPTSPFRSLESIQQALAQHKKNNYCPVVSVSPSASHPLWTFQIHHRKLQPYTSSEGLNKRSQDLPPAYALNGNLYVISSKDLRSHRSFLIPSTEALIQEDPHSSVDIDTEFDFLFAEYLIQRNLIKPAPPQP